MDTPRCARRPASTALPGMPIPAPSIRKLLWCNDSVRSDGWRSALSDRDNPQRATSGFRLTAKRRASNRGESESSVASVVQRRGWVEVCLRRRLIGDADRRKSRLASTDKMAVR
jgi:hypothetical protein